MATKPIENLTIDEQNTFRTAIDVYSKSETNSLSSPIEAYKSITAPDPELHPLWYDSTDGSYIQYHGTPPSGAWVNVSHEEVESAGIVQIGFLGDSITETASEWKYETFVGVSINAVFHSARYEIDNLTTINVAHANNGPNQSLSVTVSGNNVVVNLATDSNGEVTSKVTEVVLFCNLDNGYKGTGLFARTLGNSTHLAQVGTAKYLAPATATTADGYAAWLQLLSNGKFEPIRFNPTTYPALLAGSWTFGKSGLTTSSLVTFILPDVLILGAGKTIVEMSGTNDVLDTTVASPSATTIAKRLQMWDAMQAADITVVACEILPLIESSSFVPEGANLEIVGINAALKSEALSRSIQWIEWPITLFDGLEAKATLWEVDGIHPNPAGCYIMGEHVLSQISPILSTSDFEFPIKESSKWITENPYMEGSGAIATGWQYPTAFSPATVTPTAITIGGRRWQRLTVAQNGAGFKLAAFNLLTQPVTPGDRIRILADLKVSSGFKNVRVKIIFNGPGGEIAAMEAIDDGNDMESLDYTVTLPAHEGPWLSHPELVPTGATSMTLSVWSFGSGTIDIGICGVINTGVVEDLIWPVSPTDGYTFTQNGIQWVYNAAKTRWARYRAESAAFSDNQWTFPTGNVVISLGELSLSNSGKGVLMKSPNGAEYRVMVLDGGALSAVPV